MIRVLDSAGSTLVEWGRQQHDDDDGDYDDDIHDYDDNGDDYDDNEDDHDNDDDEIYDNVYDADGNDHNGDDGISITLMVVIDFQ